MHRAEASQFRLRGCCLDGFDRLLDIIGAPLVQVAGELAVLHLIVQFDDQFPELRNRRLRSFSVADEHLHDLSGSLFAAMSALCFRQRDTCLDALFGVILCQRPEAAHSDFVSEHCVRRAAHFHSGEDVLAECGHVLKFQFLGERAFQRRARPTDS